MTVPLDSSPVVLTVNGGSSSIKFALFELHKMPRRIAGGQLDRIGERDAAAANHQQAADRLMDWVGKHLGSRPLSAIGHRLVHGGLQARDHQRLTPTLLEELRGSVRFDLSHLPREITLIEACAARFPGITQVGCFDTAFHRSMPRVAQRLPIPRKYGDQGLRRLGFHGLSYTYLMDELARLDPAAARGRVILAHLGSGASMAAVSGGAPIDTTMGFTPLSGLVMGTRPGDLDAGLLAYLIRNENLSPDQLDDFLSRRCGLLGVSGTMDDMRSLVAASATDLRAAEAVELFCYRARQWIGSLAASMNGVETLVFAGGIGERSAEVRSAICRSLQFLDIEIDEALNAQHAAVISAANRRVTVRIIATDEESVIAQIAARLLVAGAN